MNVKWIFKITAVVLLVLEGYWVLYLGKEPHALSLASGISSLFGVNSLHETLNKKDDGI